MGEIEKKKKKKKKKRDTYTQDITKSRDKGTLRKRLKSGQGRTHAGSIC